MAEGSVPQTEMIEKLAAKLSPRGREVLEAIDSRQEDTTEIGNVFASLPPREQEILLQVFDLAAQHHAVQAGEDQKEATKYRFIREIVLRAKQLSGEGMTVGEAVEWLRREGRLSDEEERFYESIKDEWVRVPNER